MPADIPVDTFNPYNLETSHTMDVKHKDRYNYCGTTTYNFYKVS